ncbi:hypothetical protein C8R43DRAFT_1049429 [Mycena crocata]|nr:hypothetical protein C8R43DRAFT_1049429 [Mycena crocata]
MGPTLSAASSQPGVDSSSSPPDAGYAQLASTPSLVPSRISDTANSDPTAQSISSSLCSSEYDTTAPPNSLASSNSPKFLSSGPALGSSIAPPSTPIQPVAAEYFAHPEVQKSHIDGARIPVAGQPGSISAASYSTNTMLPTASARTTSSPPSIFSVEGTSVAVNSTTTEKEKSTKAFPSNEVLATLAAEGVARYFEAEGLSGAGPFVTTSDMTPPALDWEQRSIFTGNENATSVPNGHTGAEDAQRAEFSDARYGVLGREEAASVPQTNTNTVAGGNGTGSAVFTPYGGHPTAPNLGTQATGVSDDFTAEPRTQPKDSTPKTEKRRSRLVAKIREKMHVG